MADSIDDKILEYSYEDLCVLASKGILQNELKTANLSVKDNNVEFASEKKEDDRIFLAGFSFKPITDITVVQDRYSGTSLVTYSLSSKNNKLRIMDFHKRLLNLIGIKNLQKDNKFIREMEIDMLIERETYEGCKFISKNYPNAYFDNVFGMIRYANFLQRYKGIESRKANKLAAEKIYSR